MADPVQQSLHYYIGDEKRRVLAEAGVSGADVEWVGPYSDMSAVHQKTGRVVARLQLNRHGVDRYTISGGIVK